MEKEKLNEIAKFLGYLKHEIQIKRYIYNTPSKDDYLFQIEEVDRTIYDIAFNCSFESVKLIVKKHEDLLANDVLRLRAIVAMEIIKSIPLNQVTIQLNDLPILVLKEYDRLMGVIGLSEYAELIGWDKKKLSTYINREIVPKPIKRLNSTPLWTIGQFEYFDLILKNRELNNMRGDWTAPYVQFPVDTFEEYNIISNFTK